MICEATSVRSSVGFKISALVRQSSVTSNTLWARVNFGGQITVQRYVAFVFAVELRTLYIQEPPYMDSFCECILKKNRTYACTFPVQRKEMNVVKVRFTMRYSSRKLSNGKVITTACNFWRQIACSFKFMSRNILILGKKIFEIPPFSQTRPGDLGKKSSRMLIMFFRPEEDYLFSPASLPVVLGDFGCDVTYQACRENSPRKPRAITLGSKPPLVTRIARTGLVTRLCSVTTE